MNTKHTYLLGGIVSISLALILPFAMSAFGSRTTPHAAITSTDLPDPGLSGGTSLGKEVYNAYCANCHGVSGDGKGPDAYMMKVKPRDFTSGIYEFKSTPVGTLPTDGDIIRTLELGVRTTAMLPQLQLSQRELLAVTKYLEGFSPRFKEEKRGKVIAIPPAPQRTPVMIREGRANFVKVCATCHGTDAEGNGPSAKSLVDYNNRPIRPENLTLRPLKRANKPREIYITIAAGLDGTPMPSFLTALKPRQIWSIVYYLGTIVRGNLASENGGEATGGGMMGGSSGMMGGGMMGGGGMRSGGMMGHQFVGEEAIGARIDMAAARAWMMRRKGR